MKHPDKTSLVKDICLLGRHCTLLKFGCYYKREISGKEKPSNSENMSRQIVSAKKILLSLRLKRYKNWIIILGHIREGKNKPKQHNPPKQPPHFSFWNQRNNTSFYHMLVIFTIFHESNKIFLYLSQEKDSSSWGFCNISNYVSQNSLRQRYYKY